MAVLHPRLQPLADQYQQIRADYLAKKVTKHDALAAIAALSATDDTGVVWGLDENGAWWTENVHGAVAHNVNPAAFYNLGELTEGQRRAAAREAEKAPSGWPPPDYPPTAAAATPLPGLPYDDSKQTLALILGLCTFLAGIFTGIPAIIIGSRARKEAAQHRASSGKALAGVILGWLSVVGTVLTIVMFVLFSAFLASKTPGGIFTNTPDAGPTTSTASVKLPGPWTTLPVGKTNMVATINGKPATIYVATTPKANDAACATLVATLATVAKRYGVKPNPDAVFPKGLALSLADPAALKQKCMLPPSSLDSLTSEISAMSDSATLGGKTVVIQTGKAEDLNAENAFNINADGASSTGSGEVTPPFNVPPSAPVVAVFETS